MGYYAWENRRRERRTAGMEHQENSEFFDLTDKQNLEFRVCTTSWKNKGNWVPVFLLTRACVCSTDIERPIRVTR
jgi:hypothetical protein